VRCDGGGCAGVLRHGVADYTAWKKVYDDFEPTRKKMGVFYQSVHQSSDYSNDVTVIHDFHSPEQAKAFINSPNLKAAMEKAGVKGYPQIWSATKGKKH
jgi:quinol monooxygenase YgiN